MTTSKSVFARFLVVVTVLAFSLTAVAQVQYGQITGTVVDQQGAAISGATVKVTSLGTNVSQTATTSDTGAFSAKELSPGPYKIVVEKQGFKTASQASFTVNAGVQHRVDFKLTVGERTEVVEVVGTAPLVETQDSKLATTVGSTQISNLPLNGRNVYDLIQMQAGAVNVEGVMFENGHNTVVNGMRENFGGFLINGVSNKGLSGGNLNTPIQDAVQEFQQLTLNNSAQYGNSAGSVTNLVTKSGTNAWHGSAWWFHRNDNMDAIPFFIKHAGVDAELLALTGEPKPELRFNQFGGTFGGPIMKDKLFFFASYQGDRFITATSPQPFFVESPAWQTAVAGAAIAGLPGSVAGLLYSNFPSSLVGTPVATLNEYGSGTLALLDSTTPGIPDFGWYLCPSSYLGLPHDPTGVNTAQAMANIIGVLPTDYTTTACGAPLAVQAGTFGSRDNFFLNSTVSIAQSQGQGNLFHGNEALLRLDWVPREKDRFSAEFNWYKASDAFQPTSSTGVRGFVNPTKTLFPHFSFSWVHTFNPRIVNEFRAGYVGNVALISTSVPGVPSVYYGTGELGFGSYNGYPQFFKENIYSYGDVLSISKGKHNLKIGYDLRRNIESSEFDIARPSYYFLDPLYFSVDAAAAQAAGVQPCIPGTQFAASSACGTGPHLETNNRHWRNWEHGLFFQDDWKITRNLTLNLGIRYDLFQRHTELNNLETTFIRGPGIQVIDNITTGAGWMADANFPAGGVNCADPVNQVPFAQLAGVCGTGGFAGSDSLGKGDHNNWGPRVGFAWDVFGDGKTSIRGGFGISYEGTLYNPLSNSRWNLPYYSFNASAGALCDIIPPSGFGDCGPQDGNVFYAFGPLTGACPLDFSGAPCAANNQGAAGTPSGEGTIQGWDSTNPNFALLTGIILPEGIRDPYVYNFYLSVQRELPGKMVIEGRYVGTSGHKLFRAEDTNRIPAGRLACGTTVIDQFGRTLTGRAGANCFGAGTSGNGRLNPNYGTMRTWLNNVNSNYNAFQVELRKQTSHGLTFNFNYTWSHSLDAGSNWHSGATSANGAAGGDGYTSDQTLPKLDYGNSTYDIRHRWVLNYIWEMPWFKNDKGLKGAILGGWQWNGIWSFQTGAHWSPFCSNCDFNRDGQSNERPNALGVISATHDMWADGWGLLGNVGGTSPLGAVGSGAFFTRPCTTATACIGNLRRNQFVGPNYFNVDFSLMKNFKVTERVNLQFRAESFNFFNRTNFQLPNGASGGNQGTRVNSGAFGTSNGTFNPRQIQLGLRMTF